MTSTTEQLVKIFLLLLSVCHCPFQCEGTKHSFKVHNDARTLIGPVGLPFGYLEGGEFDMTVLDFELKATGKNGKDVKPGFINKFWGGFFLSKFENEAAFNQYIEHLQNNASICSYEYFRYGLEFDDDNGADGALEDPDDDFFDDVGDAVTAEHGLLIAMNDPTKDWKPNVKEFQYTFQKGEDGLYFLLYQICPMDKIPNGVKIRSSFELDFHFRNYNVLHRPSYLTAGEMSLPLMYLLFTISYALCLFLWVYNMHQIQAGESGIFEEKGLPIVYPIHHLMAVLVLLKTLSTLFESIRYHYIRVTGHAELWSVVFYSFTFLKGTMLFIVILLIGSGWSSMKPFLNPREKKIIFVILVLQTLNQLLLVIVSSETNGEKLYGEWTALLHIFDIICCCMVLLPIVWQVDALEKSIEIPENETENGKTDDDNAGTLLFGEPETYDFDEDGADVVKDSSDKTGDKAKIIARLKLFRSYYLLVVAYIYCTRILVYLFANLLNYKTLWVQNFTVEIISLLFYVGSGMQFRPKVENVALYTEVNKDEENEGEDVSPTITDSEIELKTKKLKQQEPKPKLTAKEID